ncbi:heat shock 70 kDa protein 12A-like [Mercenaria mercenaria]|uniref:heat shock 70 kDa protein 12A-like n=1 Tax=Mercenaria mercenaria TaxID=6596 RepID=UPI00234EDAA0|nr:heat shock 70 kDa protein 12A-like [Mercenaria mercenaria]
MDPDIRMSLQPSEDRMASAKDEQKGATGFDKKKRSKMHKRSPQTIKTSMKPTSVGTKPPVVHTIRGRLDAPTTSSIAYVAIDLGTSYSGYTIAVGNILYCPTFFVKLPTKTPSVILLDENKHIRSFGYEAEELYTERQEIGDHLKWYCFRRFKTIFSSKEKVTSKDELVDENGRKMKALDVFAAAIHYFRNKAMEWLRKNCGDRIMDRDVRWIFTIPSEPFAAQFMREASFEAGLHRENISVLLESESLSAYFQLGCLDDGTRFYKPGTKYMIIDIGGKLKNKGISQAGKVYMDMYMSNIY